MFRLRLVLLISAALAALSSCAFTERVTYKVSGSGGVADTVALLNGEGGSETYKTVALPAIYVFTDFVEQRCMVSATVPSGSVVVEIWVKDKLVRSSRAEGPGAFALAAYWKDQAPPWIH